MVWIVLFVWRVGWWLIKIIKLIGCLSRMSLLSWLCIKHTFPYCPINSKPQTQAAAASRSGQKANLQTSRLNNPNILKPSHPNQPNQRILRNPHTSVLCAARFTATHKTKLATRNPFDPHAPSIERCFTQYAMLSCQAPQFRIPKSNLSVLCVICLLPPSHLPILSTSPPPSFSKTLCHLQSDVCPLPSVICLLRTMPPTPCPLLYALFSRNPPKYHINNDINCTHSVVPAWLSWLSAAFSRGRILKNWLSG